MSASRPEPPPAALRVLLVTGVDHPAHDWKATAPALRAVLEEGRCAVKVVDDPSVLATDEPFRHDVILLHFRNDRPLPREAEARDNLAKAVRGGKGLVLVHFACGAFGDWPEFGRLAGMVWDGKNTHDPRGPFTVRVTDRTHPVTRGLADFTTDDELYIGLKPCREVDVLAVGRSTVTGRDHPLAFAFEEGKGRVFHTALGHDVKAIRQDGFATLLRRGTAWAGGRTP